MAFRTRAARDEGRGFATLAEVAGGYVLALVAAQAAAT
jgi:hypothetical protein